MNNIIALTPVRFKLIEIQTTIYIKEEKTYLTALDIDNGFKLFINNVEVKSRKDNSWSSVNHMYS